MDRFPIEEFAARVSSNIPLQINCLKPATETKKLGILTFHLCINYGSYWQAKCLAEGLQSLGFAVEILNHVSPSVDLAEWRVALNPTQPIRSTHSDRERYACKVRKFYQAFQSLPVSAPFSLEKLGELDDYDGVVIGSDEVWNLYHPWYAQQPAFFGQGFPTDKVISYAASFGNYSCWQGLGSPWTDFLQTMSAISVRDENSWWMLRNSIGLEASIVLDPCLQFPPQAPQWSGREEPFILVYGHNFSSEYIVKVKAFAKARNFKLLSIGYRNDWADLQWLDAGPDQFLAAMTHSQAVATNFFHGCVFSLINRKPFASEVSAYRSIKVRGLLELIEALDRLVSIETLDEKIAQLLSEPPDDSVYSRIKELRHTSLTFLEEALPPCPAPI